jgi:hypothetical protein
VNEGGKEKGNRKRTLSVEEKLTLSRDDRLHDNELEDGADDGTERLSPECGTRRKLRVLSHL